MSSFRAEAPSMKHVYRLCKSSSKANCSYMRCIPCNRRVSTNTSHVEFSHFSKPCISQPGFKQYLCQNDGTSFQIQDYST
jgi:hypothetical protein